MTKTLRNLCVLMTIMLWPMAAMAQTKYYVTLEAEATGTGSSWDNAMTLAKALEDAKAGDEIWMKGYEDTGNDKFYYVPGTAGYTVKSGVKLYGGFRGVDGETLDGREVIDGKAYRMKYRTVISGDISKNDTIDATNLIFPANGTRTDNATHVLTLKMEPGQNSGSEATEIDGITIAGGHAEGTDADGQGGGIFITGDNSRGGCYIVRRCFFIGNYATEGGALYVADDVTNANGTCLIDRCGFFNNAAGTRGEALNAGGAVSLDGAGTIVNTAIFNNENGGVKMAAGSSNAAVVNTTVTRNTASGIDGQKCRVANTVIWGNSRLYTDGHEPSFNNCAYPEANPGGEPDGQGNIYLATRNNEEQGPHFDSPSLKTGFDTDYDVRLQQYPLWTWMPLEGSNLIDKGDNGQYDPNATIYGSTDLDGNPRTKGDKIDIGAFEFQPVTSIRYVKKDGTGDGRSWDNASGDLQAMIDQLAESGEPGEVWVAAGEYEPLTQLLTGTSYSASFRMRDGVSVYGGFDADNPEDSKTERKKGTMPWEFENKTILSAAYYNAGNLEFTNNKWTTTSDSRHVVWFAPLGEGSFTHLTYLDGVTIRGGYAQGGVGLDEFKTDRGAGVYIDDRNAYLTNCTVTENYATGNGGGVYLKGGRVQTSLIYNNNADQGGGAVYVDESGLVHRSMLANNSARNGAGVYLDNTDGDNPEYLILSTCVVTNNTATGNGAIYCNRGGVLLQNTVANNQCVTSTDLTDPNASQTGGLYINEYALVANSVIWNNRMGASSVNIPMYAKNPTAAKVRFMYNAISGVNNAVWNNTLQEQTLALVDENRGEQDTPNSIGPRFIDTKDNISFNNFSPYNENATDQDKNYIDNAFGVQQGWRTINYYWQPIDGSNLWARGMALGQLPREVLVAPEIDIAGGLFAQKPAVGAFHVKKADIVPRLESDASGKYTVVLYVDVDCTEPKNDGSSWSKAYRSLNDAISYFSEWKAGMGDKYVIGNDGKSATFSSMMLSSVKSFEIRVLEGDLWPRYAFVNEDPKTATLDILKMQSELPLKIVGGYYRNNGSNDDVQRDPLNHRSQLNGNSGGSTLANGLYHVVTVETGAQVELDGFHIINGYAASTASLHYGAGMLVHDNAQVTLTNCIFENNTADNGAALYAPDNATVTMQNCVVNNNTNTLESNEIIAAKDLTLQHVTVVNNVGAAPAEMGATSFSAGNTFGVNTSNIETTGKNNGAENFANPTNDVGATLGFNTYLGGYSSFRPLTSSSAAADNIINKVPATGDILNDIMGNDRDLGGAPDLGAYEADLPKAGSVLYVRTEADGGDDDNNDGLSWNKAFATLSHALDVAENDNDKSVEEIWVAKGTYTHSSNDKIHSQYYGYKFVEGVNVYGGFSNSGAPNKNDRNPRTNETILQTTLNDPNNSLGQKSTGRVLVQKNNFGTETVYDGFTLQNGYLFSCYRQDISGNIMAVKTEYIGQTGGAGVYLMVNGIVENCVIRNNYVYVDPGTNSGMDQTKEPEKNVFEGGYHQAGAGVYNDGGIIRNCNITENRLIHKLATLLSNGQKVVQSAWMYGAGLYMNKGTVFNTVISDNESSILTSENLTIGYHEVMVGTGAFLVNGNFYNNTVVGNKSETTYTTRQNITLSGVFVYEDMQMYNCIVSVEKDDENNGETDGLDNASPIYGYPVASFKKNELYVIAPDQVTVKYSCILVTDDKKNLCKENDKLSTNKYVGTKDEIKFADGSYELTSGSPAVNAGTDNIPSGNGGDKTVTIPDYDANYTNRIKDCAIDMGAYELDNKENIKCTTDDQNVGTYYVSQNGAGLRSGENPGNAACASKLQSILDDADSKIENNEFASAVVKVAGCNEYDENGNLTFKYSPTALANESDPQSYTFVVPDGVTVMGGYYEGDFNNGVYIENSGWDEATDEDKKRNAFTFRTVLSAIAVPSSGSTITQEVNGYHAVTFGEWPGTTALTRGVTIDGVWLVDGSATSMSGDGSPATMGGGAIVQAGAHVRNCVVTGNAAIQGGGLYVMPGGTVSGTAVLGNTAEDKGGGIYAANTDADNKTVTDDTRVHIISCTIADNEASTGGGLYLEDGASMQVNTVIWGNIAGTDKNVSGVTNWKFADSKLAGVFEINAGSNELYPFNNCFVESYEMPSDFENASLEGNEELYFVDNYRRPKDYSLLIKHGVRNKYQGTTGSGTGFVDVFNVAETDIQGILRVQDDNAAERLDAGAFAYEGGILPTDLFTRIFVSQTKNVTLPDGTDMMKYLGKSFYTSFSTLEDALGYIRSMRKDGKQNVKFEVLVAGGTYKPTNMRDTKVDITHNQRLYSFEVPAGVSIYGGFNGNEFISSKGENDTEDLTSIPGVEGNFECMGKIGEILSARDYSDFNQNNLYEPWELAEQTILSGQINVSSTEQNAYHVIYSEANGGDVVLDGITVMDGKTAESLSTVLAENEQGRGGGIYSNGVNYTLCRCRVLNNTAVRGGGVFVRNADLNFTGCILAGNKTVAANAGTLTSRGGAAYIADVDAGRVVYLRAVNTLWANNESAGEGGAIGSNFGDGITSEADPMIDLMNNTFVKNKAGKNPVIYNHNAKGSVVNTLIWGNEGTYEDMTDIANISVSHSASDVNYGGKFDAGTDGNIMLDQGNMDANGPRFTNPATTAGAEGYDANNLWNPVAISVVTDAGDGVSHTENRPEDEDENVHKPDDVTGAYNDWFDNGITEVYIKLASTDGTTEADNPMEYSRYSGPRSENNEELCKTIDIGVYEYQYYPEFSKMDKIYVDTISHGTGSGEGWANATDDLRGAIIGAANPMDNQGERIVYVRDGEYSWDRLSSGSAYILNMGDVNKNYSNSLTIKGSCTGVNDQQDFSKQTVVRAYEDTNPTQLMLVATNAKDVNIEGFTFINNTGGGTGINASTTSGGSLTLKNCAFRCNKGSGMNVSGNGGNMLVYNTLFADGGTGLTASSGLDNITLVNTTFANNKTADMSEGLSKVYNSASWNNEKQLMPKYNNNKVFGAGITNDANIHDCPNFVDPDNGDYHILPSLTLLNQGSNAHYAHEVLGEENVTDETATIPGTEVDLGNSTRLVDDKIDIGAYEYEAPLQPIAYVKADVRNPDNLYDGKSWKTALPNLQGAANLVGIYAYNHKDENVKGNVFVHRNLQGQDVRLTLGNTNVYGGMNDETVSKENKVYLEDGKINVDNVKSAVKDLLDKRAGLIENTAGNRSTLNNVTISAEGSVVDGFEVNGEADIDKGYLSTSIIKDGTKVNGDGILYNSLVYGNVSGITAVNVTATGTISEGANNRASVDDTNTYVTDGEWKYQLMETSTKENGGDIDAGTDQKQTGDCINMVGHNRDIAGNKRIRNVVDNGCFETWDINTGDSMITENDYPHGKYPHGRSVVYVREGRELSINERMPEYESTPFNPGVLLLEHQAGLRGNGNSIGLSYVIMERNVPAGGVDMAYAPFQATMENVQGNPTRYYYDGAARAAYDYTFDANNGSAWTKTETETYNYNMGGLLLDNTADERRPAKVRFVGKGDNVYLERPNVSKFVTLDVNNFSDQWTANNHTGNKFTAKENMSWNLFGSPYLCAMNYDDMEYGRVIYGYQNNGYVTVKTYNDDGLGDVPDGYIPAGDAIFTQTAALSKSETFTVEQPVDDNKPTGTAYGGMEDLKVTITRTGETRAAEDGGTDGDVLQLNAVAPDKSRTDFDMGSDGVKWMADGVAQIYAVQGGGRYSLLSAVNIDGKVSVGVTLPEAGMYTIAVPDDCLADGYESVILEDAANGRKTNLLEGGYDFTSTTAGDIEGRFSISFNRMIDDRLDDGIRAYSIGGSLIRVEGVEPDDRIMVYSADGMSVASHVAASSVEDVRASVAAVAVVKVVRGGQTVAVRKIKVS